MLPLTVFINLKLLRSAAPGSVVEVSRNNPALLLGAEHLSSCGSDRDLLYVHFAEFEWCSFLKF